MTDVGAAIKQALAHYQATGMFRPEDLAWLVGSPRQKVSVEHRPDGSRVVFLHVVDGFGTFDRGG